MPKKSHTIEPAGRIDLDTEQLLEHLIRTHASERDEVPSRIALEGRFEHVDFTIQMREGRYHIVDFCEEWEKTPLAKKKTYKTIFSVTLCPKKS